MARIFRTDIYDYQTLPTFDDYVIGTDPEDSNRTRNYRIADIIGLANGTATRFTTLFDTPESYLGESGQIVAVNSTEDALEFIDPPTGGGNNYKDVVYLPNIDITSNNVPQTVYEVDVPAENFNTDNDLLKFRMVYNNTLTNNRNRGITINVNDVQVATYFVETQAGEIFLDGELYRISSTSTICTYLGLKSSNVEETESTINNITTTGDLNIKVIITDELGTSGTTSLIGYIHSI